MYCLHHIIEQWGCSNNEEHINITNLGSSWNHFLMLRCSPFRSCFSAHASSHASPHGFTHASHIFNHGYCTSHVHYLGFHGSRSRNRAHDHRIAPKVAAMAWYFFPKSCVECILWENLLIFFLFFLHSLIFKWIMDLNMLWLQLRLACTTWESTSMDVNVLPSIDKGSFLSFLTTSEQHLPVDFCNYSPVKYIYANMLINTL